jgi:putative ABC transport system ATP-binding protein
MSQVEQVPELREPAARRPLLEVSDVHKSYRRGPEEVHALQGAHLSLTTGEIVALVGPSGSGKTTLLNVLCGWEHPDRGEVTWVGEPPMPAEDRPWSDIAIVPQGLGLIEELSIRENVELATRLAGGEDRSKRVEGLLKGFGLDALADREPQEVSLGEQQRTALSRALVLRPRLLLADEPTGHQDEAWARGIFRALRLAAREGTCCLVATHNREVVTLVDRVVGIRDGQITHLDIDEVVAGGGPLAPSHDAGAGEMDRFFRAPKD